MKVIIIMGSTSDEPHAKKITGELFPFPDVKESIQDRIKEKLKDS